jgi:hypothetical protein
MRIVVLGLCAALAAACGNSGPAVLAKGEQGIAAVAADASGTYWLAASAPSASAAVVRRAGATADQSTTLASDFQDPRALVVSGGALYWASGDGKIRSIPTGGGAATVLATEPDGTTPFAIGVVNGTAYWLTNVPAGGTPDQPIPPQGALVSAPAGGGPRTVVAQFTGWDPSDLTADLLTTDATTVYWTDGDGNVSYLDQDGAAQFVIKRQGQLSGLAIAGGYAWYLELFSGTFTMVRKQLASLDPPKVLNAVPYTAAMVNDDHGIYLAGDTSAAVSKVSFPDGALSTLLTDDAGAAAVALGPPGVLIVATGDGRVLRLSR